MKFTIRNSAYTSYFDRNLIRKNAPTESCCYCYAAGDSDESSNLEKVS